VSELGRVGLSQKPEDQAMLRDAFSKAIRSRTLQEWSEVFAEQDACVEPVLSLSEASAHPQLQARGMVIGVSREGGGEQPQIGHPLKFSATPCESRFVGRKLGADTDEVLASLAEAAKGR